MINKTIGQETIAAYKAKDIVRKSVLQEIKATFQTFTTSNEGKDYEIETIPDAKVISILKKIEATHQESINLANGREDIIKEHTDFLNVLKDYLPAAATTEDIKKAIQEVLATGIEPVKKNMGMIIKTVKEKLPTADGKEVSQNVMAVLN